MKNVNYGFKRRINRQVFGRETDIHDHLSSVLEKIRVKGFYNEFKWTPEGFTIRTGKYYQPEDLP